MSPVIFSMPAREFKDMLTTAAQFAPTKYDVELDDAFDLYRCVRIAHAHGWLTFTATDVYRIGCCRHKPAEPIRDFETVFPAEYVEHVCALLDSEDDEQITVTVRPETTTVTAGRGLAITVPVSPTVRQGAATEVGFFPKTVSVWKNGEPALDTQAVTFRTGQIAAAAAAFDDGDGRTITCWQTAQNRPLVIRSERGDRIAMIMPAYMHNYDAEPEGADLQTKWGIPGYIDDWDQTLGVGPVPEDKP